MKHLRQLNAVIEEILESSEQSIVEKVENTTMDEYKELNIKCDTVISKIKSRKGKKTPQQNT